LLCLLCPSSPSFRDLIKVLKWYVDRIIDAEHQDHFQQVLKVCETHTQTHTHTHTNTPPQHPTHNHHTHAHTHTHTHTHPHPHTHTHTHTETETETHAPRDAKTLTHKDT